MTDLVFAFHRDQKLMAKLHLHLRPGGSVFGSTWHGDASVKNLIKPLPEDDQQLRDTWYAYVMRAARREGFDVENWHEGDPLALPDAGYPGD